MDEEDRSDLARTIHVLMAGGGTAGHVFPALAVAADLLARGHRVSWAGRAGSMEESLVVSAGLPYHELKARPWVGKGAGEKLLAATTLAVSSWRASRLVKSSGADVVLGTGGYVSLPAVLGARLVGRPAFVIEPNARAGAANRLVSRWCEGAFVAHDETVRELRCRCRVTGIPVRDGFHRLGPLPAGPAHLLILGGSQGALEINRLVPEVIRSLAQKDGLSGLRVTHQTGRAHRATVEAAYAELGMIDAPLGPQVEVVPFVDDMAAAMERAHLVVSRAGALATAELAAAGRPAVLIPLLGAGAGHQRNNAEQMEAAGAAVTLGGRRGTAAELERAVAELLGDRQRLESMARAARSLAEPGSASEIATVLEQAGRRG